jgi:hypothetical protein
MQRGHGSRRHSGARRIERRHVAILGLMLVSFAAVIAWLSPSDAEKPLVRFYMPTICESCERYAQYLRSHGFRVSVAADRPLESLRAEFPAPSALRSSQIGVVNGLFVEGHVPAADIHRLLARRYRGRALGLIVPGRPPGAPGVNAALPEPFTVFLVRPGGLAHPVRTYDHYVNFN